MVKMNSLACLDTEKLDHRSFCLKCKSDQAKIWSAQLELFSSAIKQPSKMFKSLVQSGVPILLKFLGLLPSPPQRDVDL